MRENAASERKSHVPTTTAAAAASASAVVSPLGGKGAAALWPEGGKCAVRARHLSSAAVDEVERVVADEDALYDEACLLGEQQQAAQGPSFTAALEALRAANSELAACAAAAQARAEAEARAHAAVAEQAEVEATAHRFTASFAEAQARGGRAESTRRQPLSRGSRRRHPAREGP